MPSKELYDRSRTRSSVRFDSALGRMWEVEGGGTGPENGWRGEEASRTCSETG